MRFQLSAIIALVSSTAYLGCGPSNEGADDDDAGGSTASGGTRGGVGGASTSGGGEGGADDPGSGGTSPTGGKASAGAGNRGGSGGGAGSSGGRSGASGKGGAGGVAGSGGDGGTAGASEPSRVTFDIFAFYRPALVSGADGVLHFAFNTNTSPSSMHYARCASDCGVGESWTVTIVGTHEFTGNARLVVGSDDRLHLLYDVSTTGGPAELIYATCASDCTDASSWTTTDLASLFDGGWTSPTYGTPLVIDAENRLSFTVDRKIYLDGGVSLATCASGCGTLGNWSAGTISATGTRTSLAAHGTTLHQLIDNAAASGTGNVLGYRTCAADCTDPASWEGLADLFVYDGAMPNAIAVTAEGGVRVAYNQGQSDSSQPAAIKAQDDSMLIWGCEADCLDPASWSGFVSGAPGDGVDGISMAELGGALVLSVSNNDRILTRFCGADCLLDTSWSEADIDTTAAVTDEYDAFAFTAETCEGDPPQFATWHLTQGVVALRPDASVAFAHTASILRTCPGSSSVEYFPGFGRLVFVP